MTAKCIVVVVAALGLFVCMGQSCGTGVLTGTPQITNQIRASCWWVNDVTLRNGLDAMAMDRDAGFTSQQAVEGFSIGCIDTCTLTGGEFGACTTNCTNCAIALAAEVW